MCNFSFLSWDISTGSVGGLVSLLDQDYRRQQKIRYEVNNQRQSITIICFAASVYLGIDEYCIRQSRIIITPFYPQIEAACNGRIISLSFYAHLVLIPSIP